MRYVLKNIIDKGISLFVIIIQKVIIEKYPQGLTPLIRLK